MERAELDELKVFAQTLQFASPANILSKYLCNYCGKVCLEALQAKCKHLYCRKCLDKFLNEGRACPVDKSVLTEQEVTKNDKIQDEIKKLPVYCPFRSNGCMVSEPLHSIPKHIQICEAAPLQCPQGCDQPVDPSDLEHHLRFTCSYRHVSCDFCDKLYVLFFKKKHLQECPRNPIECPNDCGVPSFPKEELSKHLEECSVKLQLCRHQHLGCHYQGAGSALREHEGDITTHFQLMATGFGYLNLNFDILLQETKSNVMLLQNENYALRESLKTVMTQCENLSDSGEEMREKLSLLRLTTYKLMQHKDLFMDKIEKVEDDDREKNQSRENNFDILFNQLKLVQDTKFKIQDEMIKTIQEQEERIRILTETSNCSGVFVWKITDYHRRKEESLSRRRPFEYSEPFFTDRYGYQACLKVYLGGEGEARGTHLSLFLIIMRGKNDNILKWPFTYKFQMEILDHKHTHEKTHRGEHFSPNHSSSFQKPTGAMNTGAGLTRFMASADIEGSDVYLRNDTIYIRVMIIPNGGDHHHRGKHKKSK